MAITKETTKKVLTSLDKQYGDTIHRANDRMDRVRLVNRIEEQEPGVLVAVIRVDKGHWNGAEIHEIYSNGIIKIFNERTKLHITDLIARPNQIKRYFDGSEPDVYGVNPYPKGFQKLLAIASEHQRLGYNNK